MMQGLNQAQREAVLTRSGPMMVLAAAGTGKTRVITYRIAQLVRSGVLPDRILAVTFTNKAAREMKERARALLSQIAKTAPVAVRPFQEHARTSLSMAPEVNAEPLIGTFHSVCVRFLRQDIDRLGYPKSFGICDSSDQDSFARTSLRACRVDPKELAPGLFLNAVGRWKNQGWRAEAIARQVSSGLIEDGKLRLAASVYPEYESSLRSAGMLDFDDILLCAEELFRRHADVLDRHRGRFDHLLVDEYQDTNAIQYRLLRDLASLHRNICVVGDDDQSIYGWRGAEIANLQSLERDFPGTKIIRLEENYRSCPNILRAANRLIANNTGRYPKELRPTRPVHSNLRFVKFADETEESAGVVRDLAITASKDRLPWRSFAILFRTNEQPRLFEQEFRARNIPYTLVGGYSFFDRKEIRDALAYLKVLANPADEVSLRRIINTPARGVGPSVIEKLVSRAAQSGKPLWEVIPHALAEGSAFLKSRGGLERFVATIERFRSGLGKSRLVSVARDLLNEVDYKSEVVRAYPEPKDQSARMDSLHEFINMVAQYEERTPGGTLEGFLESTALATEEDRKSEDDGRDKVTLMTLHSAKGLEFPHVYMVGMEERILPHERSMETLTGIEEERRLCYVGITRARDQLTLSRACARKQYGKTRVAEASRFLPEIFGSARPSEQEAVSTTSH